MELYKKGQTVFGVHGDDVEIIKLDDDTWECEVTLFWSVEKVFTTIADAVYHIRVNAVERCRKSLLKADKIIEDYYNLNHN
jgi:hypothetical protein